MKRMAVVLILAVGALTSGRAMAQSSLGLKGIGGSLALVDVENVDGTFGLGISADMGHITPQVGLEPVIEYWSKTEEAFGSKASIHDVSVGARAKYYFEVANPKVEPFAGAGLGLHFIGAKTTLAIPGFPSETVSASDTKLGLDLGGGLQTPLTPKDNLRIEGWYGVVSDVGQLAFRVGVSHKL
jgi:opacity protein-like surface antigen